MCVPVYLSIYLALIVFCYLLTYFSRLIITLTSSELTKLKITTVCYEHLSIHLRDAASGYQYCGNLLSMV